MSLRARNTALSGLFYWLFGIGLAACAPAEIDSDPQLVALAERIGAAEAQRRPEAASTMGLPDALFGDNYGDLLDDRAMAAIQRNRTLRLSQLAELEAINPAGLSPERRQMRASLTWMLGAVAALDAHGYGQAELGRASPYVISFADGAYADLVKFMTHHAPVRTRTAANAWLKRLEGLGDAMRDERRRFEVDIEAGAAPPASVLRRTLEKARQLAPANPRQHALVTYFVESLVQIADIPEEEVATLLKTASDLVGGDIKTEYANLIGLLERTLANAPDDPGVWRLKDGEAYYAEALRLHTTTELSARQLNEAGMRLIAELSAEIDPILVQLGIGEGAIGARMRQLANDPAYLLPDTPEGRVALLAQMSDRVAWAQKELASVLPAPPKAAVEIREAARLTQESVSGVFYKAAALDGSRPAIFNVNLRSTLDFPTWSLPTLAFHEATPGHHIQAGLARERTGQLTINYFMAVPAFSEGWATYAEDLAAERGAYKDDPLARLGYLRAMMLRAARLVVDTGMHAQKWSRAQALEYLEETVGISRAKAETEVDRMTIWPGLACSYMAGRETIRRLRTGAERELKSAFDLKAFHEAVLAPGARPLPVLEADIADWIMSRKPAPPAE